jgi:hypothetical protein
MIPNKYLELLNRTENQGLQFKLTPPKHSGKKNIIGAKKNVPDPRSDRYHFDESEGGPIPMSTRSTDNIQF